MTKSLVDNALLLDRLAFAEWWNIVDWRLHASGAAERLFQRAYAAGVAEGLSHQKIDWEQPTPSPRGRPNLRFVERTEEAG